MNTGPKGWARWQCACHLKEACGWCQPAQARPSSSLLQGGFQGSQFPLTGPLFMRRSGLLMGQLGPGHFRGHPPAPCTTVICSGPLRNTPSFSLNNQEQVLSTQSLPYAHLCFPKSYFCAKSPGSSDLDKADLAIFKQMSLVIQGLVLLLHVGKHLEFAENMTATLASMLIGASPGQIVDNWELQLCTYKTQITVFNFLSPGRL